MYPFILLLVLFGLGEAERSFRYISTEHPVVIYNNPKFIPYANMTSRRYGRRDPFYYVGINFHALTAFGNNYTVNIYFYEFLTHRYEKSFVELRFKFCDLVHKDNLFGTALRQGRLAGPCPYPPGSYYLSNMTMSAKDIPRNFPFTKGRIVCNMTITATKETVISGHIDMEIKEWRVRKI